MRHTRLAPLWRALPGIGIAAVAVFCGVRRGDGRGRARSGVRRLVQAHDGRHGHGRDAGHELLAGRVGGGAFHSDGTTRTYYISADQVDWDYAPPA